MDRILKDYLKRALSEFTEKVIQENEDGSVEVVFGTTYDDTAETTMRLKLTKRDDFIEIDDKGLTFQYLDKIFELAENDVIKNIEVVKTFYGVEIIGEEPKSSYLVKRVTIESNILIELFRFRDCIAFLNAMKIFYI